MKIGMIGGGAIAQFLLKEELPVKSILVRDKERYDHLETSFGVKLYTDLDDFLNSGIDLLVEAANIEAVKKHLPKALKKMDVIVISVGAFAEEVFLEEILEIAEASQHRIHLPSGAIGGLDLLQNAKSLGELRSVTLRTRKPAHTLLEEDLDEERIIFSGPARKAIKKFPKNINVAIVLSLAGIGVDQTSVEVIADPLARKNEHGIFMEGSFGSAELRVINNPMEENPNTSYLAALSILGTIKRLKSPIQMG